MATQKLTKQQMLDKTPENNNEVAIQNLLHIFSKTKLEQFRRMFNEISTHALYKTQLRQLSWQEIHDALSLCVSLNQNEKNE